MDDASEKSRNRWFFGGLAIAILHPFPGGLIMGILMMREPGMKENGRTVLVFSLIWGLIVLLLALKYGLFKSA